MKYEKWWTSQLINSLWILTNIHQPTNSLYMAMFITKWPDELNKRTMNSFWIDHIWHCLLQIVQFVLALVLVTPRRTKRPRTGGPLSWAYGDCRCHSDTKGPYMGFRTTPICFEEPDFHAQLNFGQSPFQKVGQTQHHVMFVSRTKIGVSAASATLW